MYRSTLQMQPMWTTLHRSPRKNVCVVARDPSLGAVDASLGGPDASLGVVARS